MIENLIPYITAQDAILGLANNQSRVSVGNPLSESLIAAQSLGELAAAVNAQNPAQIMQVAGTLHESIILLCEMTGLSWTTLLQGVPPTSVPSSYNPKEAAMGLLHLFTQVNEARRIYEGQGSGQVLLQGQLINFIGSLQVLTAYYNLTTLGCVQTLIPEPEPEPEPVPAE